MERLAQIKKLSEKDKVWDIVVVGGGATGLGVAVGNALDEIKEIADYISADNDHEGVTEVIEKFILEK